METETQLQRFKREGWLSTSEFRSIYRWMSADDRFRAGNRLYQDFYQSGIATTAIPDLIKPRVDGGRNKDMAESQAIHLDAFRKALRAIPVEFFGIVQAVVLDDRNLIQTSKTRRATRFNHEIKLKLCMGLDRLVGHYKGER